MVEDRETAAWEDGQSHKEPLQLDSEAEVEAAGAPESAESLVAGRGTSVISSNFRNLFPKNLMNAFDNCSFVISSQKRDVPSSSITQIATRKSQASTVVMMST